MRIASAVVVRSAAAVVGFLLLGVPTLSRADRWETPFQVGECVARGLRQYSAHLLEIVGSWEAACYVKPADISGQHFDRPNRCVNKHLFGMWGEFDVADSTCPHWGVFKQDECTLPGKRQFSSILYDIPRGMDWQTACYGTPATIGTELIDRPRNCSQQVTGMWGEFEAMDSRCEIGTTSIRAVPRSGDVLSSRQDDGRTGAALTEKLLTPDAIDASRNPKAFGRLFQYEPTMFGQRLGDVYAQPLYVSRVRIPGHGLANVLLIASMQNFMFALDADGPKPGTDGVLWGRGLGTPPTMDDVWRNCSFVQQCLFTGANIRDSVGVMGTPYIDRSRGIIFVVARVLIDAHQIDYRLHALDLHTGVDLKGSPVKIAGAALGVTFNSNVQNQRPGLAMSRGQIIIGFGSYADELPYHGWVFSYGYNLESGFSIPAIFVSTPDGDTSQLCAAWPTPDTANNCAHGGIWMNGRAPAVDMDGRVLVMVGNGRNDRSATKTRNFGNSLVALDPITMAVLDFFTPDNHLYLNAADLDLGGSGPLVVPGFKMVVGGGKQGVMHVWRLDALGSYADDDKGVLQKFPAGDPVPWLTDTGNDHPSGPIPVLSTHAGHIMGGPVYWSRNAENGGSRLYNWSEGSELRAYRIDPTLSPPVTLPPIAFGADVQAGHPGGILTLSANGGRAASGIVWASTYTAPPDALNAVRPGVLRAYAADNLRSLWSSADDLADKLGDLAKFNPPTVANGRVYSATFSDKVVGYGLSEHRYVRPAAAMTNLIRGVDSTR